MKLLYVVGVSLLFSFHIAQGNSVQEAEKMSKKLDSLMTALEKNNKSMGSFAVLKNGEVIYQRAIGGEHIVNGEIIPATQKTRYRIGSITKTFTAVLIMQLVEQGKLSLATPLADFFPDMPNAKNITIKMLLGHTSGLHSFTDDDEYLQWKNNPTTKKQLLEKIKSAKPDFQPGERTEYSNVNYLLLGFILEDIYKVPYSSLILEKITSKLSLNDTYYSNGITPAKHEAHSYYYNNEWQQADITDMSIPHAAGALVSTPKDLTTFIREVFQGKIISRPTLQQMLPAQPGLGLGIIGLPFYNRIGYGHNGNIDAFESSMAYFPEDDIAIAYCSNGGNIEFNDIMIGVLSIVFDRKYEIPTFQEFSVPLELLELYAGNYNSPALPIAITVTVEGGKLFAQATGQPKFPLSATSATTFVFEKAGVKMVFSAEKGEFTLLQGGGEFLFSKKK